MAEISLEEALARGAARLRPEDQIPVIVPTRADVPGWLVTLMSRLAEASKALFPSERFERQQWVVLSAADALRRRDPPTPEWLDTPLERYTLEVLFEAFDPRED